MHSFSDRRGTPMDADGGAFLSAFILSICGFLSSPPKRRGAKKPKGLGQDAVVWIGRERSIAENRSARWLTDEPWTASRWSQRGWAVAASVNGNVPGAPSPALASVLICEIRVIRGQPLLAKLDDLTLQMLGAMMAMLKVLILGNEQSEATTDVADSTDIYASNAPTLQPPNRSMLSHRGI